MLAVGGLHHPNVVQAHDAGEINGVHYLLMEYVEGQNFQELVKAKWSVSVVIACKAIRQAAQGLAAAHKLGLVHRDIKPSNLFVTKQAGQIKILDLGLALLSQEEVPAAITSTGQCFGTPDDMAPEQWNDAHTCDARTAFEAMAYQTRDVVDAMQQDSGVPLAELKVDCGASANNLLLQFQSDILPARVHRPVVQETSALGADYLAGIEVLEVVSKPVGQAFQPDAIHNPYGFSAPSQAGKPDLHQF